VGPDFPKLIALLLGIMIFVFTVGVYVDGLDLTPLVGVYIFFLLRRNEPGKRWTARQDPAAGWPDMRAGSLSPS